MLRANNEPALLHGLGPYSALCDTYGVDFLFAGKHGLVGVQRKACADLVASLRDHRVFDLITKSADLAATVLLIEGDWEWDRTGFSRACRGFTHNQLLGITLSMQRRYGIIVVDSPSLEATAALLPDIESWFANEDRASSLLSVAKQNVGVNGKAGTALRVWQCVPGISIGNARALYDAVGLPLALTVDEKTLAAVPKIGPKRVKAIRDTFGGVAS